MGRRMSAVFVVSIECIGKAVSGEEPGRIRWFIEGIKKLNVGDPGEAM